MFWHLDDPSYRTMFKLSYQEYGYRGYVIVARDDFHAERIWTVEQRHSRDYEGMDFPRRKDAQAYIDTHLLHNTP